MVSVLLADDGSIHSEVFAGLLARVPGGADVYRTGSGAEALETLHRRSFNVIFASLSLPDMSALDLFRVLSCFKAPPPMVLVASGPGPAAQAFELGISDYLITPVRPQRLANCLGRVAGIHETQDRSAALLASGAGEVQRILRPTEVLYVQARGGHAYLHTAAGTFRARASLEGLEQRWAANGFFRVHRSYLVSLAAITEVSLSARIPSVLAGGRQIPVSRRHLPRIRAQLNRYSSRR